MSPTLVYGPDGRVVVALGAAGGATIMAQVAKALVGVLDWKLTLQDAIAMPQIMGIGNDVRVEKGSSLEAMAPALTALGHNVIIGGFPLKANGVQSVPGGWTGGADPRSEGVVVGTK
jgi:gamma-glutamyltranspeptidase/glutathione hydrolase